MPQFVELEIGLQKIEGAVQVGLCLDRSDSEADVSPVFGVAALDAVALQASGCDGRRYGHLLAQQLLADNKIKKRFETAVVMAAALDMPLRVRISIDRTGAELHRFAWESLCDPGNGEMLTTKEQLGFWRFIKQPGLAACSPPCKRRASGSRTLRQSKMPTAMVGEGPQTQG